MDIINRAFCVLKKNFFFLVFLVLVIPVDAQTSRPTFSLSPELTEKYSAKINKKVLSFDGQTTSRTKKSFKKFQRQEKRLHKKLCKVNPELADKLFSYPVDPLYY